MIPQFLHWVLACKTELGRDQQSALCAWRDHHPSWRPIIWASDPSAVAILMDDLGFEVRALPLLVNHRLYSLLGCHDERAHQRNYPHHARSIVASIEIMARYGGVCVPMGEPCSGNIESLLQGVRLFTLNDDSSGKAANFSSALPLYGAMPNHPALWNIVSDLRNCVVSARPDCGAISAASLVELVRFRLERHPDNVAFPAAALEVNSCSTL